MNRVLISFALLFASRLANASNAEQCARLFTDKEMQGYCENISNLRNSWTDDELKQNVTFEWSRWQKEVEGKKAKVEQCARLFTDKEMQGFCEDISNLRNSWTDDELKKNVSQEWSRWVREVEAKKARELRQKAAANEKAKADAMAIEKKKAAIAKLESESQSTALSLKGLYPGITLEKAEEYHPGIVTACRKGNAATESLFTCNPGLRGPYGPRGLDTLKTLAGQKVDIWLLRGKGSVIWEIWASLPTEAAMDVGAALAEKYKFGMVTKPIVTNRMGAKFENFTWTWKSGELTLTVQQYGSSIESGVILFTSARAPRLSEPPKTKDL